MQYKDVQNIAKMTIQFIKENIQPGMTLIEIRDLCETKMIELGADSFWYWDVGAFVFAGDETTLSVSGKEYTTSERVIAENDIITIDLSPQTLLQSRFRSKFLKRVNAFTTPLISRRSRLTANHSSALSGTK